ncbi:478_t:CDS:1, partial [Acaulospora morrowiae]
MKTLPFIFAFVLGFVSTTKPAPVTEPTAPYTITLVERSPFDNLDWPQYLEAQKRHLSVDRYPSLVSDENGMHLDRRGNKAGAIGLDVSLVGPITVGQQKFDVVFDVQTATLFVPSVKCKSYACVNQNKYDEKKSKTFKSLNDRHTQVYGSGPVVMDFGLDDVTVAGFTAKKTAFGVAIEEYQGRKIIPPGDGVLGMALEGQAYKKRSAPFSTLFKQGSLKNPVVGIYVSGGNTSSLTVGGVDKTKFTGQLKFVKTIDPAGHWFIPIEGIYVNNKLIKIKPIPPFPLGALIHSSTQLMNIPRQHAAIIYKSIPGAKLIDEANGIYGVPCDTEETLAFQFNGLTFRLTPKDWIMKRIDKTKLCQGGLVGHPRVKYW